MGTIVVSMASYAVTTDDIDAYHAAINYTTPVLTTDTATGNTIYTLKQCKSYWSKFFTNDPSNLENNTGIHYEWTYDAGNGVQNGINQKFAFDGVSVKLANIGNASNAGSKRFALIFSSKNKTAYSASNGVLRILFNGRLGYAIAAANGKSVNILGDNTATATDEKNAIFKDMSDKTVYVDIAKKEDNTGDYEINLTIGDKVLTDTLPASLLTGLDFDPAGQCYVSLSAVNITGQAATTIDFLGVGSYSLWKDIELDNPNLYYHGRTFDVSGGVGIDWSNSGVSLSVKASEVNMTFKAQNGSDKTQGNRAYVWVFVNGERSKKILLTSGEHTYNIATGLNPEEITEISVIKSTEATFSYIDLTGISVKGSLEKYEPKIKKIEVIGDSISAGYGILSEAGATGFKAVEEDSTYTYAALLADKFNAELTLLASSGSGVFMDSSGLVSGKTSASGKPANIWPDMYDYSVAARGQRGSAQSITKEWDFTNDHPDLIIVNLGTNDAANAAKLSEDELNSGVAQAVKTFLTKLTTTHPNAQIVWCYGLMNQKLTTTIKSAVESFGETNDKVSFIELPNQNVFSSTTGADRHPNAEANEKLADYIFSKLSPNAGEDIHSKIDYTVPVLTTDTVTGNTIYSLEQSKKNWSNFFVTDPINLENNTGIHYEWTEGAGNGVSNGINKKFDFNGVSVKLGNIGNKDTAGSKRFEIIYTGSRDVNYTTKNGALRIGFNGRLGYAVASVNGQNINILGDDTATANDNKNALFKNMSGKTVYVDISKKADNTGDYTVTLTIGDMKLTDIIPASLLAGLNFDPAGQCYVGLSAYNIIGQAVTSIDFLGVGSSAEVDNVISLIDAIETVDLLNGAPIKEARAAYDNLTENGKKLITNYQVLLDAETEYAALAAEADADLYSASYHTAHLSNQKDSKNVVKTMTQDWAPYLSLEDVSTGGLRYNFTGAGSNIREGFSRFVSIDGLYIQFDNLVRESNKSAVFALVFGSAEDYIGTYTNNAGSTNAFAIVFDTVAGKIYALSNGEHLIISDDIIKYDNLKQKRFSVYIKEENHIYTLTVEVNGKKVEGTFSGGLFENAAALKNPNVCRFAISSWTSGQYFSLDLIGVGKDSKVDAVEQLINEIGIVTIDSGNKIEKATKAYEALSDNEKERVLNYSALIAAEAYYIKINPDGAVEDVINYIDDIGEVTIYIEDALKKAEDAYMALSDEQKKAVTNADVLEKAIKKYYKLIALHLPMDQYAYSPLGQGSMYSVGTNYNDDSSWDGKISFGRLENGVLRLTWKDARRDMCQGVNAVQDLNGLRLQFQNLTSDEGKNGTQLAVLLSPTSPPQYYAGGKSMALVLDTEKGEIRSYPGGYAVMKDKILKQDNIADKNIYMWFTEMKDGIIRLRVAVGEDTVTGVISAESVRTIFPESTSCYFSASPWTECSDDLRDNTTHSFSVDIVSIYTAKKQSVTYVFQSVLKLNERIDSLADRFSDDNSKEIRNLLEEYRSLNKKLKPLITSYSRLSKLSAELFEKESLEKYGTDIPGADVSPDTGEKSFINFAVMIALISGMAIMFINFFNARSKRREEK